MVRTHPLNTRQAMVWLIALTQDGNVAHGNPLYMIEGVSASNLEGTNPDPVHSSPEGAEGAGTGDGPAPQRWRAPDAPDAPARSSQTHATATKRLRSVCTLPRKPLFPRKPRTMSSLAAAGIQGTEEDAPDSFFCCIEQSGELMRDPVSTQDGHSYERTCIEGWFRAGNITSPATGLELPDTRLTPNIALKNAIEEWEAKHLLKIPRAALHLG
jgi:hypothetical protein